MAVNARRRQFGPNWYAIHRHSGRAGQAQKRGCVAAPEIPAPAERAGRDAPLHRQLARPALRRRRRPRDAGRTGIPARRNPSAKRSRPPRRRNRRSGRRSPGIRIGHPQPMVRAQDARSRADRRAGPSATAQISGTQALPRGQCGPKPPPQRCGPRKNVSAAARRISQERHAPAPEQRPKRRRCSQLSRSPPRGIGAVQTASTATRAAHHPVRCQTTSGTAPHPPILPHPGERDRLLTYSQEVNKFVFI